MYKMADVVLHSKTQVWITIATFIIILISMIWFWIKLWGFQTDFEYVKSDITEIKEKQVEIMQNQISMDKIMVTLDDRYEKKR